MKAWLRTVMAVLLTGGLVYLVLEEKYKRKGNMIRFPVDENTKDLIAKMRAEIVQSFEDSDTAQTREMIDERSDNVIAKLDKTMEEFTQSQQGMIDSHDDLMVAMGRSDLAKDPLSAEFRLAMERKRSK
jgi:hypothetical protein